MPQNRLLAEKIELVAIGRATLKVAERRLISCEHCNKLASLPFEWLLDVVTGRDSVTTRYVLSETARCTACGSAVVEETRVHFKAEEEQTRHVPVAWADTDIVLVDGDNLLMAQSLVAGCDNCCSTAEISFDYLLDEITGCDPTKSEYVLLRPAVCPNCSGSVTEKTLIVTCDAGG